MGKPKKAAAEAKKGGNAAETTKSGKAESKKESKRLPREAAHACNC